MTASSGGAQDLYRHGYRYIDIYFIDISEREVSKHIMEGETGT